MRLFAKGIDFRGQNKVVQIPCTQESFNKLWDLVDHFHKTQDGIIDVIGVFTDDLKLFWEIYPSHYNYKNEHSKDFLECAQEEKDASFHQDALNDITEHSYVIKMQNKWYKSLGIPLDYDYNDSHIRLKCDTYHYDQFNEIVLGFCNGMRPDDVHNFSNPGFSVDQMRYIKNLITTYHDPHTNLDTKIQIMKELRNIHPHGDDDPDVGDLVAMKDDQSHDEYLLRRQGKHKDRSLEI